ncbi:MAG TPA: hypothetical protein VD862_03055 [Candidatus Paceibacterota bacterium]|nr:hypothetical protein [Candidatus Paceibacterota bacterium]
MENQPAPAPVATPPAPAAGAAKPNRTLTWLAVIFAVVVLAGAYATYAREQGLWPFPPPAPVEELEDDPGEAVMPAETPDPTEAWERYENDEFQFSFRYPAEIGALREEGNSEPGLTYVLLYGEGPPKLTVWVDQPGSGISEIFEPKTEEATVDGSSVPYQIGNIASITDPGTPGTALIWRTSFSRNGNEYLIELMSPDGSDKTELFLGILSTFRIGS